MKEFIYRIEDNESDESEVFIGWIRKQGHELIRCKECKYADDMPIADGRYWCNYHKGYFSFCSEAKRKEE